MSASIVPSAFFGPGYAASSGSHTISFNTQSAASNKTLPQLLDAAADPTTGDLRQILFAIIDAAYNAQPPVGSRVVEMNINKSIGAAAAGGGAIDLTYTARFSMTPGGIFTPVAEP